MIGIGIIASGIVQAFAGVAVGSVFIVIGVVVGLAVMLYAQFMYNRGRHRPSRAMPLLFIQFFSFRPPDSVDMSFKITAVYQFCNNELLKGGDGAGKEAELFFVLIRKLFR